MVQKYNWRSGKKLDLKDPKEIRNVKVIMMMQFVLKIIQYLIPNNVLKRDAINIASKLRLMKIAK